MIHPFTLNAWRTDIYRYCMGQPRTSNLEPTYSRQQM